VTDTLVPADPLLEEYAPHRSVAPSVRQVAAGATTWSADERRREIQAAEAPVAKPSLIRLFLSDFWRGLSLEWLRERTIDPRPFVLIAALSFSGGLVSAAFTVVLTPLQQDVRLPATTLATVLIVSSGLSLVAGPIITYQADRHPNRFPRLRMLSIFGFVGAFGGILTGLSRNALTVFGGRSLTNFGSGLVGAYSPIKPGVMSDFYDPRVRGSMFGSMGAIDQLALVIGPLAAAVLAAVAGWRVALIVTAIPLVLSFLLLLRLREPVRGAIDKEALGVEHEVAERTPEPPRLSEAIRILASVKTLRRFWFAQPFLAVSGEGIGVLVYLYFQSTVHPDPFLLATIAVLTAAATIAGNVYGGSLVQRLMADKPGRPLVISAAISAFSIIAYVGMSVSPFLPLTIAVLLLLPFAAGVVGPSQATILSMVIPGRVRTFGFGTMGLFQLIGYPFLGAIYALASAVGFRTAMLFLIPLNLVGAAIFASCSTLVAADIRAAEAAALAERSSREARQKLLICRDVDVTYAGGVQVLFNVDLDINEGEIVALLGTNGAGKSTLLRAISGLTEASNGAIFFDGRDITHLPTPAVARLGVVQVLGGRAIFPRLTVEQNLQAATWLTENDEEFVRRQRDHILNEFFPVLKTRLNERAGTLSGGEQQMLALSQAFLMKPRLLMIDELSLGLSPAVVEQLLRIVRAIHHDGTTIILVEQSVNVALTLAQRAVFMEKGEVRFDGSTEELLSRPDLLRSVFFASAGGAAAGSFSSGGYDVVAQAAQTVVLQAEHLQCSFGGVHALNDAHLTLSAGEIVGIIGPNGAGKSTLFDAISGFARIQEGRVVLQGRDVTTMSPDGRARLGLIRSFQDARLFPSMTVGDNLAVALERYGVVRSAAFAALWLPHVRRSETRIRKRVDDLVELLNLGEFVDKFAGELSTGTRRVVDLACMMAADPEVLLLDEPSSGIAQAEVQSFAPLLERVRRETGCAIAIIEHDMTLITAVSDRLVAMELGSVVLEGSADTVLNDPRVVAAYLGTSKEAIARSGAVPV
jgi:branched-chain amino acid transport system ATP-binding protein